MNDRSGSHSLVEVIKAGINGYFPEAEKLLLKHYGLRYSPAVVVVGFVPNDVLDTHRGLEAIRVSKQGYLTSAQGAQLGELGIWCYVHSHLARLLLRAYIDSSTRDLPDDWWMDLYRPSEAYANSWTELFAQYDEMLQMVRESGAVFVVLHIPNTNPREEFHSYPAGRMAEWCESRKVLFVDALPALRAAESTAKLYWDVDPHCTPEGYRVIAATLFKALTTAGVVR